MQFNDIAIPDVYRNSSDFRTFLKWFGLALTKLQYDTENFLDLYDPLRCRADLLWMLADTMGFKYDDRLPTAYNRLVLVYFMSMIRLKGSKDGITLAAETNLAQFVVLENAKQKDILNNRLEDTSIPVNSVFVDPRTDKGYIDVIYFSTREPINACIEYVRPVGLYLFLHPGVRMDARNRIHIDARLTNIQDNMSIAPTHVGHYSREDYARLQKTKDGSFEPDPTHTRRDVWYRNSEFEGTPNDAIDPGYRAMNSLQLANNENIVKALMDPIFSLGYHPLGLNDTKVRLPDNYLTQEYYDTDVVPNKTHFGNPNWAAPYDKRYNLLLDAPLENALMDFSYGDKIPHYNSDGSMKPPYAEGVTDNSGLNPINEPAVETLDYTRANSVSNPKPKVNPVMKTLGDAISMDPLNRKYFKGDK